MSHFLPLTPSQRAHFEEYLTFDCAEDRLTFLVERVSLEGPLTLSECNDSCRVPGCVSGLWLKAEMRGGSCRFLCRAESKVVEGVVSLLCDLSSGQPPERIASVTSTLAETLKLEQLLTTTRKMAVAKSVAFLNSFAAGYLREAA